MKFLSEFDISEKTIELIENVYPEDEKKSILSYIDRIYSSILFLRNIGVTNETIEKILIEDYHILLPGKLKLERAVSKVNQQELVNSLNSDINYMHYLKDII